MKELKTESDAASHWRFSIRYLCIIEMSLLLSLSSKREDKIDLLPKLQSDNRLILSFFLSALNDLFKALTLEQKTSLAFVFLLDSESYDSSRKSFKYIGYDKLEDRVNFALLINFLRSLTKNMLSLELKEYEGYDFPGSMQDYFVNAPKEHWLVYGNKVRSAFFMEFTNTPRYPYEYGDLTLWGNPDQDYTIFSYFERLVSEKNPEKIIVLCDVDDSSFLRIPSIYKKETCINPYLVGYLKKLREKVGDKLNIKLITSRQAPALEAENKYYSSESVRQRLEFELGFPVEKKIQFMSTVVTKQNKDQYCLESKEIRDNTLLIFIDDSYVEHQKMRRLIPALKEKNVELIQIKVLNSTDSDERFLRRVHQLVNERPVNPVARLGS